MPEIKAYVKSLPAGKLFPDRNRRKAWESIREAAKLPKMTRQDLRKTCSTLLQLIGSIGSAQKLMEHSSHDITKAFYSDEQLILRWKINQLPVKDWLKGEEK